MSGTPRTDAYAYEADFTCQESVDADDCRSIERDLIEARTLIQSTVGGLYYLANVAHGGVATISEDQKQGWHDLDFKMKRFLKRTKIPDSEPFDSPFQPAPEQH